MSTFSRKTSPSSRSSRANSRHLYISETAPNQSTRCYGYHNSLKTQDFISHISRNRTLLHQKKTEIRPIYSTIPLPFIPKIDPNHKFCQGYLSGHPLKNRRNSSFSITTQSQRNHVSKIRSKHSQRSSTHNSRSTHVSKHSRSATSSIGSAKISRHSENDLKEPSNYTARDPTRSYSTERGSRGSVFTKKSNISHLPSTPKTTSKEDNFNSPSVTRNSPLISERGVSQHPPVVLSVSKTSVELHDNLTALYHHSDKCKNEFYTPPALFPKRGNPRFVQGASESVPSVPNGYKNVSTRGGESITDSRAASNKLGVKANPSTFDGHSTVDRPVKGDRTSIQGRRDNMNMKVMSILSCFACLVNPIFGCVAYVFARDAISAEEYNVYEMRSNMNKSLICSIFSILVSTVAAAVLLYNYYTNKPPFVYSVLGGYLLGGVRLLLDLSLQPSP